MARTTPIARGEMQCERCAERFRYDEVRRCRKYNALTCMNEPPGDLCPECLDKTSALPETIEPVLTLQQDLPAGVPKVPARHASAETAGEQESLAVYRRQRDFSASPEPVRGGSGEDPLFVIQKHAARRLHYDLRLEVEGVLKSWSVPRGPSSQPADRRLAVQVEDHPLSYHDFEGVIPKGQYGAGRVTIWDHGTYRNLTGDPNHPTPMAQALEDGKVEVFFKGTRIKGGYALIRMRSPRRDKADWLLIKLKDEYVGSLPADLEEK